MTAWLHYFAALSDFCQQWAFYYLRCALAYADAYWPAALGAASLLALWWSMSLLHYAVRRNRAQLWAAEDVRRDALRSAHWRDALARRDGN